MRDGLKLQVILTSGKFLFVSDKAAAVLENIRNGRDQFVEMRDTGGFNHFVNVDHVVEVKEVDYVDTVFGRRK